MSDEATPGLLVRQFESTTWEIRTDHWRLHMFRRTGGEFCATLYQSHKDQTYENEHEFAEGVGETRESALASLRKNVESRIDVVRNALSFDWKVDG